MIQNENAPAELCWFCRRMPRDPQAWIRVLLYGVGGYGVRKRSLAGEVTEVFLNPDKQEIFVPRCTRCKKLHRLQWWFGMLGAGVTFAGVLRLMFVLNNAHPEPYSTGYGIVLAILAWAAAIAAPSVGYVLGRYFIWIPPPARALRCAQVEKLTAEGWEHASQV